MARAHLASLFLAFLPACAVQRTVASLQERCPPPEFGRPGWVRTCAGTGGWIGGILGGVVSIALLPATYPISWLAGDSLGGTARDEFLLFPVTGLAATGHFLFGGPPDLVDHVFRRAWLSDPPPANTYELVPMESPAPLQPEGTSPAAAAPSPAAASASTIGR